MQKHFRQGFWADLCQVQLWQNPIQFPELFDGNIEPLLESIVQTGSYKLVNDKIFSDELKVMFLTIRLKGPALRYDLPHRKGEPTA
ncbi:hypothetical protein A6R68_00718 [Neotoma lepida]|uniref:DUF4939 domain-containing protein n=1 Tax=Neotoma lepida TaxID=56216 RepID=A0A1A6GXP5_NEOLE|nr:hypothetical protein A6R68_00718 [Neotoma lepida]